MSCSGENMVRLRSSDGQEFEVTESAAVLSQTIKFAVEDGFGDENSVIPIPKVDGKTLTKVLEYCREHADGDGGGDGGGDGSKTKAEKREFDKKFVEVDQAELYDLLMAGNYLEINGLLDIVIQRVADMIKGKTPEEIRKTFKIKNDFTPEEEEQIRRENAWAM